MKYWLAGLLVTLSFNVLSDDVIVYRWVDKDNVAHFSQNQPATGNYTEILMANSRASNFQNDDAVKAVMPSVVAAKEKVTNKTTNDSTEQCKDAKKNLETLAGFDRIRFVDANGETQILDKAEQEEQITINKKIVDTYCKPSSAKK